MKFHDSVPTLISLIFMLECHFGTAFTSPSFTTTARTCVELNACTDENTNAISRSSFVKLTLSTMASSFLPLVQPSNASDEENSAGDRVAVDEATSNITKPTSRTIESCPKPITGKPNNCIATSNIKQLDNYSPPWTFEVSGDEAFARLKGLMKTDASYQIVELDENDKYMKVDVQRTFNTKDCIEFLVKGDDKVVVFKSGEIEGIGLSDLGINKKRLEDLRLKSGGVFNLMGEGLTADSFESKKFGMRNGIGGQLKAFYGLQSGEGYEDFFEK